MQIQSRLLSTTFWNMFFETRCWRSQMLTLLSYFSSDVEVDWPDGEILSSWPRYCCLFEYPVPVVERSPHPDEKADHTYKRLTENQWVCRQVGGHARVHQILHNMNNRIVSMILQHLVGSVRVSFYDNTDVACSTTIHAKTSCHDQKLWKLLLF